MKHFSYYNTVAYDEQNVTNILLRARIRDAILAQSVVYYDYVVRDGERPDIVAEKYYGSADHTWILFYVNRMLDPLYDWPLFYDDFKTYMKSKYNVLDPKEAHKNLGTIAEATTVGTTLTYRKRFTPLKETDTVISPEGQHKKVISVTSETEVELESPFNNDITDETCEIINFTHSYYDVHGHEIDFDTWKNTDEDERSEKSFYDYELLLNDRRRNIKVLDRIYKQQLVDELSKVFK